MSFRSDRLRLIIVENYLDHFSIIIASTQINFLKYKINNNYASIGFSCCIWITQSHLMNININLLSRKVNKTDFFIICCEINFTNKIFQKIKKEIGLPLLAELPIRTHSPTLSHYRPTRSLWSAQFSIR